MAVIYGLEEASIVGAGAPKPYGEGGSRLIPALVLEFVDGATLADRIAQGAIPVDEALPIARQIAEALEAAHEHGVVHRDLKPANVKLTADGVVKVLDFGLAKALTPDVGSTPDVTASPTITSPAMTALGVVLGTAAYMAPEQAKGRPADKRADVWAFGCVLYEMLTGRAPFAGDDVSDTLANVLKREPDWNALPLSVLSTRWQSLPVSRDRDAGCSRRVLGALDSTATTRLVAADSRAVFLPPDWLLFGRGDSLYAQRVDVEAPSAIGEPLLIADRVARSEGFGNWALSASPLRSLWIQDCG